MTSPRPPKKFSRADFFKLAFQGAGNVALTLLADSAEILEGQFPDLIRPPGAIKPDELFLKKCTHCRECAKACPFFAIQTFFAPGSFYEGTPHLGMNSSFCRLCLDFPCATACPTGALVAPPSHEKPTLGIAQLQKKSCLRGTGVDCADCVGACKELFQAVSISSETGYPSFSLDRCRGCGACRMACPAKPLPAIEIVSI